jgi:NAD(P)-dependent dehydrogenase (short-subunit alcohol dehydrogenase family)
MIEFAIEKFKRIDIMILNAGVSAHILFEEIKDFKVFDDIMKTNFFGYVYPTR